MKHALHQNIAARQATVGVVGLGYVGLPLALAAETAGFRVVGLDTDPDAAQNARQSHGLRVTDDYADLADADCICIAVPTPLRRNQEPDPSFITAAIDALLPHLKRGALLVLESTTWPGTTRELVAAPLQRAHNWRIGHDVFVAFAPERIDPGNPHWRIDNTPRIVGGITPACTALAADFYRALTTDVIEMHSPEEAEATKLLENTFRAVNIALVNEFALMAHRLDLDIWNIVDAAATKPFGFMPFYPGPGIGGHCIPLDPIYMAWKARSVGYHSRFIALATDLYNNMPRIVVARLAALLNDHQRPLKGTRVLIAGLAYKKNVGDLRESPALRILQLLQQKGAVVHGVDPHVPPSTGELPCDMAAVTPQSLSTYHAAVLVTDHDAFDYALLAAALPLILDCRGAFRKRGIQGPHISAL